MRLGVLLTGHAPDKASPGFRRSDDPSGMLGSDISATPFSAVYLIRPDQHVAAR
jgi:hypothetical protein